MDTPHPEIADVELNTAPGILIFSDHRGVPLSFNPAARRLLDITPAATWDSFLDGGDVDRFRLELQKATASQSTVDGWFRLRRFDNAVRQFILRAEPRFDQGGQFFGHLISGLDVSGLPSVNESGTTASADSEAAAARRESREMASRWHDWIVKDVTVISVSVDVLLDTSRQQALPTEAQTALVQLDRAAASLKREVDLLLQAARNG